MDSIVERSWAAAGGRGAPPPPLTEAFWVALSAFTTNALAVDFDHTPEQSAAVSAAMLKTLLKDAVQHQHDA
jgi:hypothetical protein